jgi:hypothetical protein
MEEKTLNPSAVTVPAVDIRPTEKPKKPAGPKPRLLVELPNFHETELNCTDGCGKPTLDKLATGVQVFIWVMERKRKTRVRAIVKGPSRCEKKQREVYSDPNLVPASKLIGPNDPTPGSMHMGEDREDHGPESPGAGLDIEFQELIPGKGWKRIPNSVIIPAAKASWIFGGIGSYSWGVHLDMRERPTMWSW